MTTINGARYQRAATFDRARVDAEARTVELSFSSEAPVERWFGTEVLSHDTGAIELDRLRGGAPLLFNHDRDQVIGVVESAEIGDDRKGRAVVRFGRGALAEDKFRDVQDGILRNVSVGYMIDEWTEEKSSGGGKLIRATRWTPLEISIVSIPADTSVGVGRSADAHNEPTPEKRSPDMGPQTTPETPATPAAAPAAPAVQPSGRSLSVDQDIIALGELVGQRALALEAVANGRSLDEFRAMLRQRAPAIPPVATADTPDIGMSEEEVRQYSFVRAINALVNPTSRAAQAAARFEFEASEAAAQRLGRESRGITVPAEVLRHRLGAGQRDLNVTTAAAGGNLVATDLLAGSFIELLRNRIAVVGAGATLMQDLNGNLAIPKQTGGATAYWVAESGAPTESQASVGQVPLSPKTVGAFTDISRRLLLQSSLDVEALVRRDLAAALALAIDLASLYGTGASNQPTGLTGITGLNVVDFATANQPTFAEIVQMESEIASDNADTGSMNYLFNSTMRGYLKTAPKFGSGTEATIWEPGNTVNGYGTRVTNQVAAGDAWFGVWANLLIGMWGGLDLMAEGITQATSGTVRVVALQDVDVACRHAQSFSRGYAVP